MQRTANCHHVMKIKTNCEEETQKYFLEAMTYKPKHNEAPSSWREPAKLDHLLLDEAIARVRKKQRKKSDLNAQLGTLEVRVLFVRLTTRVLRSMIFKTRATDFAEKERLLVD